MSKARYDVVDWSCPSNITGCEHIYPVIDSSLEREIFPLCGHKHLACTPEFILCSGEAQFSKTPDGFTLDRSELASAYVCKNCLRVRERLLQKESQ